jgi:hypothetical protein
LYHIPVADSGSFLGLLSLKSTWVDIAEDRFHQLQLFSSLVQNDDRFWGLNVWIHKSNCLR